MSYSILTADLNKDREAIRALWDRNFEGHGVPAGRYDWIYANGPYGPPTCFLLKHEKSQSIVGAHSLFPRRIVVNGKAVRAYVCGDTVVDAAHRSLGPALSLVKAALAKCNEEESSVLFGFPNNKSEPVLLFAGFKLLCDHIELTKVIRTFPYLKRHIKYESFARALSYPLDLLLHCRYGDLQRDENTNYRFDIVDSFDERFDKLWAQTIDVFSLKGVTDSHYLNWRFKNSPYEKTSVFTMSSKEDNSLCGYIVFRHIDRRVQIADLSFLVKDVTFDTLLSAFYKHQKSEKMESISFSLAGDAGFIKALRTKGFSERSRRLKTIIYTSSKNKEMISEIRNGNWYLTSGDNDI